MLGTAPSQRVPNAGAASVWRVCGLEKSFVSPIREGFTGRAAGIPSGGHIAANRLTSPASGPFRGPLKNVFTWNMLLPSPTLNPFLALRTLLFI